MCAHYLGNLVKGVLALAVGVGVTYASFFEPTLLPEIVRSAAWLVGVFGALVALVGLVSIVMDFT